MNGVKKIIAPTDLSELSKAGLRYALEMAAADGGEVTVYHVVPYNEAMPYYELEGGSVVPTAFPTTEEIVEERCTLLAKFLRENFGDLLAKAKVHQAVVVGTPYQMIVDEAAAENADMIVMSTHGRTGFIRALIGSVTEKVVRLSTCPVLTVRPRREVVPQRAAA